MLCKRAAALCRTVTRISSSVTAWSQYGPLLQTAFYNPKPLKINLHEPYIPDRSGRKTPDWQKTARYDGKQYGRYGSASGIDPASLWPSHEQLDEIIAEENEWHPPLEVMLRDIAVKEKEETEKRLAK